MLTRVISHIYIYGQTRLHYPALLRAWVKMLTSHSYKFVMKVHHINQDKYFCSVLAPTQKNR